MRSNGFKTFIVSDAGIEFMRPRTEQVYGIPPEQVVGSSIKTKFELRDGRPVLVRLPEISFLAKSRATTILLGKSGQLLSMPTVGGRYRQRDGHGQR